MLGKEIWSISSTVSLLQSSSSHEIGNTDAFERWLRERGESLVLCNVEHTKRYWPTTAEICFQTPSLPRSALGIASA